MKILCTGDLHVCDRPSLGGQRPVTEDGTPVYLAQAIRTLGWIADVAEEREVDAVLVGGDLFDIPNPSPAAVTALAAWLYRLQVELGIQAWLLLGNHDRANGEGGVGGGALEPLGYVGDVDSLRVVVGFRPQVLSTREGLPGLRVYPMPYPPRGAIMAALGAEGVADTNDALSRCLDSIVEGYVAQLDLEDDEGLRALPTLLWGHGTVGGASYGTRTVPLTDPQVSAKHFGRFDGAAWSHIHLRQQVGGLGSDAHGYVGAPDRGDFGEEGQAAGVAVLTFGAAGERAQVEWVENPHARGFRTVTPAEAEALTAAIIAEAQGPAEDRTVWRIRSAEPLTAEAHAEVVALVRRLRGHGALVSESCEVERADRQRLPDGAVDLDTSDPAVFAAALASDPVYEGRADDLTRRWRAIRGDL